jgi:hypothetical protein
MPKLRRTAAAVVGLLLALSGVLVAADTAFAMPVLPPDGDAGSTTPTYIVTHSGMSGWQVALVAIGAALAAALLTAMIVRLRLRTRLQPVAG